MDEKKKIIERFFEAYGRHDMSAIREVMDENITWHFNGSHELAGTKKGLDEVIRFYDAMGTLMGKSKPMISKLLMEENENYVIEVSDIKTNRPDGNNIHHQVAVLWSFKGNKISEGRHFFSDPEGFARYISKALQSS
jgi:ketosteroid isomerase-like protein